MYHRWDGGSLHSRTRSQPATRPYPASRRTGGSMNRFRPQALDRTRAATADAPRLGPFDVEMLGHERLAPHITTDCPWLLVYRGDCPSEQELREHVAARLDSLPKLRMRLAF